jgi:hypothetical protein
MRLGLNNILQFSLLSGPLVVIFFSLFVQNPRFDLFPKEVFEVSIFTSLILLFLRYLPKVATFSIVIFIWFSYLLLSSQINGDLLRDFLIENKIIVYMAILPVFLTIPPINVKHFFRFFYLVLLTYVLYYGFFSLQGVNRPEFIFENNFEVVALCIFSIPVIVHLGFRSKKSFTILFFIGLVVIMSGSRSGILAYLLTFLFFITSDKKINIALIFLVSISFFILLALTLYFSDRFYVNIETIDRYKFLMLLVNEFSNFSVYEWIFGTHSLTPLSEYSCSQLSGYPTKFSQNGSGECYAVILHSMIMRVIYNHGLFGVALVFFYFYYVLYKRLSFRASLAITGILLVSSLSVSGPANAFVFYSLVFAILTTQKPLVTFK